MLTGKILLALLLAAPSAQAKPLALNVGALEARGLPDTHVGVYPYLAVSDERELGPFTLLPSVGAEWCPETGRWGFIATVVADYPVGKIVGVDLLATLIHDQGGAGFNDALYLLGVGPGLSVTVEPVVLSPFVFFYKLLNAPGFSWSPGLNVSLEV